MQIRPVAPDDSVEELTELLHRAYARLASMGLKFFATHQTPEQTLKRMERGECFVGVIDDRIVATVTYYAPDLASGSPWYDRPDVCYFGQFAVEPSLQRNGHGATLLDFVEQRARDGGAAEIALDTAETAHHLIDYYSRRGYRFIEHVQWEVTNYRSVILSKRLADD